MNKLPAYVMEHNFNASREEVWKAWTDPDLLSYWYGPNIETIIHKLDLEVNGFWLSEMKMGENSMYQSGKYLEIVPPEKLVWLHSTTDENWNIVGMPNNWPKTLLSTVILEEKEGVTKQTLSGVPHDANDAELACFEQAKDNMVKGWGFGMKLIEEILAR